MTNSKNGNGKKREETVMLGTIRTGKEIGKNGHHKYMWSACEICGKERWVAIIKGEPERRRCFPCSLGRGEKANHWKGGRRTNQSGYIEIKLQPSDFFYPMAHYGRGYILEHRLVMAKHLNRCLLPWEVVHHKNGIKIDNRLENLQLLSGPYGHIVDTIVKTSLKRLEAKIDRQNEYMGKLYREIRLLQWENKQLKDKVSNGSNI